MVLCGWLNGVIGLLVLLLQLAWWVMAFLLVLHKILVGGSWGVVLVVVLLIIGFVVIVCLLLLHLCGDGVGLCAVVYMLWRVPVGPVWPWVWWLVPFLLLGVPYNVRVLFCACWWLLFLGLLHPCSRPYLCHYVVYLLFNLLCSLA